MEMFQIESCDICNPSSGEELTCSRDTENTKDPFAVAVKHRTAIVGHVPRKISAACALFIARKGTISCTIAGSRRFSADLPQGGLGVPCVFTFIGDSKDIIKIKKLVCHPRKTTAREADKENDPPQKKRKIEVIDINNMDIPDSKPIDPVWIKFKGMCLTEADKDRIISGETLTDLHINVAQELIKRQFPHISGLQSTLVLPKTQKVTVTAAHAQIIHSRGNHWIVASNIGCNAPKVLVYDSLYSCVDAQTMKLVTTLFGTSCVEMGECPKQKGYTDCGIYAIAICVSLASKQQPGPFMQGKMREHLVSCLENLFFSVFP